MSQIKELLGKRIREIRLSKNYTQEKLAELSGISRATLSKIENDDAAYVNTRTIAKLSEVFEVKPSEIFLM